MNLSNFKILGVGLALCSANVMAAHAGADGSGGGAQIQAAFLLRGYALIDAIKRTPEANAACAAGDMKLALDAVTIRVVDKLIDPSTGLPPTDPVTSQALTLDAWTVGSDMQLKTSWGGLLNPLPGTNTDAVDITILHEIYRSTWASGGPKCDDDKMQLSRVVEGELTPLGPLAQVYTMGYKSVAHHYQPPGSTPLYQFDMVVDQSRQIRFMQFETGPSTINPNEAVYQFDLDDSSVTPAVSVSTNWIDQKTTGEVIRFMDLATPQRPFILVFDLATNTFSYGFDVRSLIKLP